MTTRPCRDCGFMLTPDVRGCPRCAMNVEAERMIDRVLAGVLILAALLATGVVIYFILR